MNITDFIDVDGKAGWGGEVVCYPVLCSVELAMDF